MPHTGSSRIALAWGVRTLETLSLNSLIISSVTSEGAMPLPAPIAFFSEPRWSIAAAPMIPSSVERACMCAHFAAEIRVFMDPLSVPGKDFQGSVNGLGKTVRIGFPIVGSSAGRTSMSARIWFRSDSADGNLRSSRIFLRNLNSIASGGPHSRLPSRYVSTVRRLPSNVGRLPTLVTDSLHLSSPGSRVAVT